MAKSILIRNYGNPDVLKLEETSSIEPKSNEIVIKQTAIGTNFHDIYVRSGLYKTLSLPGTPGIEGVGKIIKLGTDVNKFKIGDRIGYITATYGGYSTEHCLLADLAIPIPNEVSDIVAASTLLKGLTVEMLTTKVVNIQSNDWVMVHAAAGGVGKLLTQKAKQRGAKVIGTVGSVEKAEVAKKMGCDYVIFYKEENLIKRVMDVTHGKGLNVVYDSVGKDTFHDSLASLDFKGHLVNFGQSSGPIENFEVTMLSKKSSTLSRPMIFHYTQERTQLLEMSDNLFKAIINKELLVVDPIQLPLVEAAKAHQLMASRTLTQPIVLIP